MMQSPHELQLIGGDTITPSNLPQWRQSQHGKGDACWGELADFLEQWWSPEPCIELQSSGSTGAPKRFWASKQHMMASARLSCQCLDLRAGQSVLLRLPMRYIAAKMMVVRCIIGGLKLCLMPPSSQLFAGLAESQRFDFAPLVSQQIAHNSLRDLERIDTILLGGGLVPDAQEAKLSLHHGRVFASYGMTETLSHIALRRINGPEASPNYQPLTGVSIEADEQGCLSLSAPHLGITNMHTTDLVQLETDGSFRILGRRDNIINSGGIKLQAEAIEEKLRATTGLQLLAIGVDHEELGQCLALLWEGDLSHDELLKSAISKQLSPYERPKFIQHLQEIPRTSSGKMARAAAKELFLSLGKEQI